MGREAKNPADLARAVREYLALHQVTPKRHPLFVRHLAEYAQCSHDHFYRITDPDLAAAFEQFQMAVDARRATKRDGRGSRQADTTQPPAAPHATPGVASPPLPEALPELPAVGDPAPDTAADDQASAREGTVRPTLDELRERSAPEWEAQHLGDDALDARLASLLTGAAGPMTYFLSRHKRAAGDPDQAPVLFAELQKALRKLNALAHEAQPFATVKLRRIEAAYDAQGNDARDAADNAAPSQT